MPKQFHIESGGATSKQVAAIVKEYMNLRVTRDRQAVLLFDPVDGTISSMTRISSEHSKQDVLAVRRQVRSLLSDAGTVMVGLVEGSIAAEHRSQPQREIPIQYGKSQRTRPHRLS